MTTYHHPIGGSANAQTHAGHGPHSPIEQSRMCIFPTSVARRHSIRISRTTSFLNGQSYTFGTLDAGSLDVGSLDVGPWKNIGTSMHTGAFRSEGVSGNGYFAREIIPKISEFPHYLPTSEFRRRRSEFVEKHAGDLYKLPMEIRLLIYKKCCLPKKLQDQLTRTPRASMLVDLQKTCTFFHVEVSTFLYSDHAYYFNTPARLENFTSCLSYSLLPAPLKLGTVILETRKFLPLDGIQNLNQSITFQQGSENLVIKERTYSLSKPYENFTNLRLSNAHFVLARDEETVSTRNWNGITHGMDWATAINGLLQLKVQKLIIKVEAGNFAIWQAGGPMLGALNHIGLSGMVVDVEIDLGVADGAAVPQQVATNVQAVKTLYGWN